LNNGPGCQAGVNRMYIHLRGWPSACPHHTHPHIQVSQRSLFTTCIRVDVNKMYTRAHRCPGGFCQQHFYMYTNDLAWVSIACTHAHTDTPEVFVNNMYVCIPMSRWMPKPCTHAHTAAPEVYVNNIYTHMYTDNHVGPNSTYACIQEISQQHIHIHTLRWPGGHQNIYMLCSFNHLSWGFAHATACFDPSTPCAGALLMQLHALLLLQHVLGLCSQNCMLGLLPAMSHRAVSGKSNSCLL
jgi:hypothetical protein